MSKTTKAAKTETEKKTDVKETPKVESKPTETVAPATEEKKKRATSAKKEAAPATVEKKADEPKEEEEVATEGKKKRQVTRESLEETGNTMLKQFDEEIENLRKNDDKNKSKGVRFLRSMRKQFAQFAKKTRRVANPSSTASNSGFMKPVEISKTMRDFVGLKENQLVSRVDVTKTICNYVKEHNLSNPQDRRQFTPDEKLAKLLGTKEPLKYYELQKQIQPHFIKK
jgi:chromatin remodeling complex protein RSC6